MLKPSKLKVESYIAAKASDLYNHFNSVLTNKFFMKFDFDYDAVPGHGSRVVEY